MEETRLLLAFQKSKSNILITSFEVILFGVLIFLEYLSSYRAGVMQHLYYKKLEYLDFYSGSLVYAHLGLFLVLGAFFVCYFAKYRTLRFNFLKYLLFSLVFLLCFFIGYFQELNVYVYLLMVLECCVMMEFLALFFKSCKSKTIKTVVFFMVLAGAIYFVPPFRETFINVVALFQSLDIDKVKEYINSFGLLAPFISFLLMIFQSVAAPLPAFLITFANAALFGWIYGAMLSWLSAMVGAILCFYIAKYLGREAVEKLTSRLALKSVDEFFEKHGKYAVLIARLLPFISFDIVSYGAGLTKMKFKDFVIATGLGQLPATLIYSYAGEMLVGGSKMIVYALLIIFAFSALLILLKRLYAKR